MHKLLLLSLLFNCSVQNLPDNLPFKIEHVKYREPGDPVPLRRVKRETDLASNVTSLLNSVLLGYDRQFRPAFNTIRATIVYIDLFVRTMGPVSELTDVRTKYPPIPTSSIHQTFSFDCYFRQKWNDPRLKFNNSGNIQLSLSMTMLDKIWKPDTYFWNGAGSYIHSMTTSNRLVRLFADGTVLYSSRITVVGKCSMAMERYPLDRQACRLQLGSYAYSGKEVEYRWRTLEDGTKGIKLDYESIDDLPQFSVTGFKVFEPKMAMRDRNYSILEAHFFFDRHFGYFLMNFYVPCTLIVLLCWVAFWTNREATGDRMGIGITSVLTMVLIANDSKTDSPKVDFPTALDVYIWICYITLYICMVEFTVVHYHTKFNTGDPEILELEREKMRQMIRRIPKDTVMSQRHHYRPNRTRTSRTEPTFSRRDGGRHSMINRKSKRSTVIPPQRAAPSLTTISEHIDIEMTEKEMEKETFRTETSAWRLYYWMLDHQKRSDAFGLAENSISLVDRVARVALPVCFIFVCMLYYNFYVNTLFTFSFDDSINTHFSKL